MNVTRNIPEIKVGICSGRVISFTLNTGFRDHSGKIFRKGGYLAETDSKKIILKSNELSFEYDPGNLLVPFNDKRSSFTVHAVTIGVDFHWQRKEDQIFKGKIGFITEEGKITALNVISIDDYLTSVISSEMNAASSLELLKAHAIVSRSWLMSQIEKKRNFREGAKRFNSNTVSDSEIIRWYDREDHKNFDVCADDHCQRYQGITRSSTKKVVEAVEDTSGIVLMSDESICDTRYSKCCGGVTELFGNVWEPVEHACLQAVVDNPGYSSGSDPGLEKEENAVKWIMSNPEAFCNTHDKKILSQVLNNYDQETTDFFRWKVKYTQAEISDLVKKRTGIDFGSITGLIPLERGKSGRITRLKIEGTLRTMIIGKELEIRKSLSPSHLYSSCFVVEKKTENEEICFILRGAGWGHGVGMCQIGAAVMGERGYSFKQILHHYFKNTRLEKIY